MTLAAGLLLALLAALPVLVATYPQMSDYPSHLARYHVMLDGGRSPFLSLYYAFEWRWSGNLGADLLVRPLAALFGLEAAGRIMAGGIPVLIALGILSVEWVLRRRIGIGSYLAFAFIWSPAMLLGFLNFGLSLAMALFAFALWVRLESWRWRWALFLPIGVLVWLCHVSGWGILGLMVLGYEWSQRPAFAALSAPSPLALPFIPLLLGGGTDGGITYGKFPMIYKQATWTRAMRDQDIHLDITSLIIIGLVISLAFARRRVDGRLGWGAVLVLLGALVMPRHIAGGDYADYRMIGAGLLIACLAIDWRVPRWALLLAPALFLVRLGVTSQTWYENSQATTRILAALDHVPQGARIASAVYVPYDRWDFNTFEHIGSWALVRRDALVNSNFALPTVHMLKLREGRTGFADPTQRLLQSPLAPIDLANFAPARQADYLWYVGSREPDSLPRGAEVIFRAPGTLLARLAKPPRDG